MSAQFNQVREGLRSADVVGGWLFGAAQSGEVRPGGDVDIAVLFASKPDLDTLATCRLRLQQALQFDEIDLVPLNGASPILRFEALCGLRLYCADEDRCAEFASLAAREYKDEMGTHQRLAGQSQQILRRNRMKHIGIGWAVLVLGFSTHAVGRAVGENVLYQVDGAKYQGYFASPGPDAPLVLLVHDWDGLTEYEMKRADMLAELGYAVFAADLFGAGVRPTEVKDRRQHTGELYRDREKLRSLLRGALEAAEAEGADTGNAVAMGYCFGGAAVLELARSGADLKGFVTFHGGLGTPKGQDYAQAKGAVLILHGSADTRITMDDFCALAKQLEAAGVSHEMITFGGAPHAFTVFGSDRYRENADKESWARFTRFLSETR